MERERWQQIDRILEAALERPAAGRPQFLASECGDDGELRAQVESLLAAHDLQDDFLERPGLADDHEGTTLDGETLGNYRIRRRLGTGGVSEVYLAEDTRLARPVALKLLARRRAADQNHVRRFHWEALAASGLNHPNILTVYEVGEWQGRDFIVTEFVEGVTLREYMRPGPLPVAASVDIAVQIANALAAAHGAGIVHRDIKPENVMVRPDGLIKVLDFGIAKHTGPQVVAAFDAAPETASGVVIGTAAYMSPEQARGQAVDARTDIWSLGVVLYEMIGGRLPFPGATPSDRIAAILEREPEPLGKVRRGATPGLGALVSRALAKDREERYASAVALAEDLRALRAAPADEHGRQKFRSHKHSLAALALLMGITAAALGAWYFRLGFHAQHQTQAAPARDTIRSVAVLPLANADGAADTEYLCDGITDTLINDLSEIPELKIMSRNSVFRYKGRNVDAQEVGDTLRVRAVLTGRMARRGDDLSVSVELVDARDNSHIWGEQYQRKLASLVHLEQDIAREITEKLRLRLSEQERDRLVRPRTNNSEAYQLYLKGRFYWFKQAFPSWVPGSAPDFSKSRDYFQRAIEADPAYALAYAWLGHYYAMSAGNGLMNPEEGWPKARAASRKALELDPTLYETRSLVAVIEWMDGGDWAGAERELRLAIQLNPNHGEGLYPRLLAAEGRFDEAILEIRRAIDLDPLSIRYGYALGQIYYYARRYEESIRQYRQALELDANDVGIHQALGDAYERRGLQREAVAEWRTALTLAGERNLAATLDRAWVRRGFAAAVRVLTRNKVENYTRRTNRGEFVPAAEYARAYMRLGQREEALRWLAKSSDEHTIATFFINVDPLYDGLRADARFQELVKRIHTPN